MGFVLFAQGASFTRAAIFITGNLIYLILTINQLFLIVNFGTPNS
jgi:hypothetical protein